MNEDEIKLQLEQKRTEDRERLEAEQTEPNISEKTHRMGTVFFAIMLLLCLVADGIDIFTGGTIGWVIGLFVDAILLISTGITKAGRQRFKTILIGVAGDSIPLLAFFPFRSGFLIWAFIKSRREATQSTAK
ncbi:MAG: hypothetical protein AAB638_04300 [Patescibacteria group bacterium]